MAKDLGGGKSRKQMGFLGGDKVVLNWAFANDVGVIPLFTVIGDVVVRIIATCTTNVLSAGGCNGQVGIAADPNAIIPNTDITLLLARTLWYDTNPNSEIASFQAIRDYLINNSNDIILTLSAQADSGALRFECYWIPRSADAIVVVP